MWRIRSITGQGSDGARIVGGPSGDMAQRQVGDRFGPQGARYMVIGNGSVLFLEDIGGIGAPGGGRDWGLRINGTSAAYYGGEGYIDIQLDGAGNATVTGLVPTVSTVVSAPAQADLLIQPSDHSCGFVVKTLPGPSLFSFSTGNNTVDVTVLVRSPLQGVTVDTVGFDIQRSDGLAINAATAPSEQLVLNALEGHLVFAHIKLGGAFTWTVDVTNSNGIPCSILVIIGSDSPQQDGQFYSTLPDATRAQLISLGLPPLPEGMQLQWFWENWGCTTCQLRYFGIMGTIAFMVPQLYAEWTYARIAGYVATAETINMLAGVLKNLLQINDGVASSIANAIINVTDPLDWPKIICDWLGEC